jgi:hypothetical protein
MALKLGNSIGIVNIVSLKIILIQGIYYYGQKIFVYSSFSLRFRILIKCIGKLKLISWY